LKFPPQFKGKYKSVIIKLKSIIFKMAILKTKKNMIILILAGISDRLVPPHTYASILSQIPSLNICL